MFLALVVIGYFIFTYAASSNAKYIAPEAFTSCGTQPCWCPGQETLDISQKGAMEFTMRCMVNYARKVAGLSQLADGPNLDQSATDKNRDLVSCAQFSHTACGRKQTYWFFADGFLPGSTYWKAGENLAWGTLAGGQGSPRSVMTMWINSAEHRAQILNPKFQVQGMSVRLSAALFGHAQVFTWVNHFGCRNSVTCK
jgi:uncharacterized protein YkwD